VPLRVGALDGVRSGDLAGVVAGLGLMALGLALIGVIGWGYFDRGWWLEDREVLATGSDGPSA
jgi:hypothetical protein